MDKSKIKHLVILMMENRSFDHYLGSLSLPPNNRGDIDGLTDPPHSVPDMDGNPVPNWNMDGINGGYADPPHGWDPAHHDFDDGSGAPNRGFVKEFQKANPAADANIPMGYYTEKTLPVLYELAKNFCICDRWFSSVMSSTWPNHKYLNSGTRDNNNDTGSVPPAFPGFRTKTIWEFLEVIPKLYIFVGR